ncbi:MAG TPA: PHB depolymerase family esterase [Casimicrobiaceae bacterium]|nr:PHB depolymerase family esterase [Casimicrobiaceae bacterium]
MLDKLRSRVRDLVARIFRRRLPEPGRFETGSNFSWRGWLASHPWIWPSRDYLLYVPRGYGGWRRRPLIVLIHGCKQTPEDISAATRIAARADANGWLVLLPRQVAKANPWSCWNWFDTATSAGRGEAAIVAAQVRAVRRAYRVHPRKVYAVGMSAGGCLAAVLGLRHPKLFAGVFVHSGVACGAASAPLTAMRVLTYGADTNYEKIGANARADAPRRALPVALLAIGGADDTAVAEINTIQLVRQYLVFNGKLVQQSHPPNVLPPADHETTSTLPAGRVMTVSDYRDGARLVVRRVRVTGLGHAWSGGDDAFPYNDSNPPDATALLAEFVAGQS